MDFFPVLQFPPKTMLGVLKGGKLALGVNEGGNVHGVPSKVVFPGCTTSLLKIMRLLKDE